MFLTILIFRLILFRILNRKNLINSQLFKINYSITSFSYLILLIIFSFEFDLDCIINLFISNKIPLFIKIFWKLLD